MVYSSLLLVVFISMILLFNHWNQNKGVIYLVIVLIATSIRQLALLLFFSEERTGLAVYVFTNFDPLFVLIGPLTYYYFRSIIKGKIDYSLLALLHLIPFLLVVFNTLPYYISPVIDKIELVKYSQKSDLIPVPHLFISGKIQKTVIAIINLSYGINSIYYILKFKKSGNGYMKKKVSILLSKLLMIIAITLITYLLTFGYIFFTFSGEISKSLNQSHFLVLLILPLSCFLFPSWLYGESGKRSLFDRFHQALKITFSETTINDLIGNEKSEDLNRIINYINESKPYLNDSFTLHDISRALNIPRVRVINCFNKQLQVSFPVYRNNLRIDYATSLLLVGDHVNTSIEGIASKAGFKSKSTFYIAFKSMHGITPVEWINKNL
ncbi:AraC family transcriptional regulator [Aquirufa lenticrescens]